MHFTYCILFCLVATALVGANGSCATMQDQCNANVRIFKEKGEQVISLMSSHFFYPPLIYKNKKYLISNFPYKSVTDANGFCTELGGYLAEIDDHDEYKALQDFVVKSPPDIVVIGGSDAAKEGIWIFPRTGKRMKYLDWAPGQPDNSSNGNEDCLNMWKYYGGKMNDLPCEYRNDSDRFMCELPYNNNS